MDDGARPGATEVGGDLLGPLKRGIHGQRPAHRVVVVRRRRAELVDVGGHELVGLEVGRTVERDDLVERAGRCPLGAGPVVPNDQVDEGVIEDAELLERLHEPPDLMVGVLEEAGVDLHLAGQHRLQHVGELVPGLDLGRSGRQIGALGHHTEL